jgi:NADH-quinone oxidoreductase subunit L
VIETLAWIVLGLPLLGCLVLALWPGEPGRALTRVVGVGAPALAFVLTAVIFVTYLGREADDRSTTGTLWEWIDLGTVRVDLSILVDTLSVMMMLVVTGVGSLIVLYSTEYMEHDRDYRRFFAEMDFFVFAMLLLVMAGNFLFLIVGWGLVGLASYLLIGFYYDRPSAVAAAKKAFVMNVIGDVGLVLAGFLIIREIGSLDYAQVFAEAPQKLGAGSLSAELIGLLLLVGAAAKSGQIPLHSWLPDAMEGPTPVSALIHAATMVTAGVYLIVRCNVLYQLAPDASDVVAVVGMVTLFVAATIACVQEDIKRVLAWSTVSQIGYMIMAAGLGLYANGMFHFLTHAFFKALLFLTAGVVIHSLLGEQSLDRMGGLSRHMRLATAAMLVGCLAISGIPPFSGFFSKDEILAYSMAAGDLGVVGGVVGIVAAGLTAFYMFRLFFRAFTGPDRAEGYAHVHGPRWTMAVPVSILAVLAAVAGFLQTPFGPHAISDWLEPALTAAPDIEPSHMTETITSIISVAVGLAGIAVAWWLFGAGPARRLAYAGRLRGLRAFLQAGWRLDEVYDQAVVQTSRDLGEEGVRVIEPRFSNGIPATAAGAVQAGARGLRGAETGLVRSYAFALVAGAAIVGGILILVVR